MLMNWKRTVAFLLILGLLCAMLASCRKASADGDGTEPILPETLEPIASEKTTDYTADSELTGKVERLRASFSDFRETPAEQFTFSADDGKVTVTGYTGTDTAVRIPAEINGFPVAAIGDGAFSQHTALEKLYIPDSVCTLGEGILTGCHALQALRTPLLGANGQAAQYLGFLFGAASYTDNPRDVPATLSYLEIGGNAEMLADFALFDCNDLLCVSLPAQMKTLGVYSMYQCSRLLAVNTEHLTELKEHALDTCSSLTRLEFGTDLTRIGIGALEGCKGIRTLILPFVGGTPTENNYLGYLFGAETQDFSKGYYPTYLSKVELLSGCTRLGAYAFYECETLSEVILPQTLTSIGVRAFAGCKRLPKIEIPASVEEIRENCFFGCVALQSVSFGQDAALSSVGINAFYYCTALTSVRLPAGLTALPSSCFAGCVSLTDADLGGVETVGKNAFRHCTALTSLTVKEDAFFEEGNTCATALLTAR